MLWRWLSLEQGDEKIRHCSGRSMPTARGRSSKLLSSRVFSLTDLLRVKNLTSSQDRGVYLILWNSGKLQPYLEKLHQSLVYLKTSWNSLLSTGSYLSMRENSNMVLVPKYKKAKGQHKSMRSDLNLAKNVIKKFEHPVIQGKTMYSYFSGGSNEGGTWRSIGSAANTDDLLRVKNLTSSQDRGVYLILWNSGKLQPYLEKLHQSLVYLKTSWNSLLSTGSYLSMRENSNMVLVPKYKKAKGQHKSMRSDLNLAKNEERGEVLEVQPTQMV
ncbi:hypothetical protein F2Q68_00012301 [Brassica cretica]|uniref:Uncharacterized protein n=1 Tax=Brassica cretica TaxID=69181 RepID=A0A8S9L235_BRACR|nr:hypothetical protein F2Q68_00012301 [Brassica cretica]